MNLVIVDALNLIRRIHAVQERQQTSEQQVLLATEQALNNSLNKLISRLHPTHIVAVFDHSSSSQSWRQQLSSAYKAQRSPMPEALAELLPKLQDQLLELGIESISAAQFEADDICATIAVKAQQAGCTTTIVSTDQGYYSLLERQVQVYDYFKREFISVEQVEEKLGIKIAQILDYWSLVGVSGVGINGVSGIGKKTAQHLLHKYGSCHAISIANDPTKAVQKVQNSLDALQLAQQLVSLKTDLGLGFTLKQLRLRS